ncbi:MBOAT family protein [Carboxylicivirga mesophila]|uniref:MBOAT family protein n=1 Tax=Carboxylicivirga mesophila TaxID=1166478 RepID=A0ABS5KC67_9BACT|nr:MBOAT family protein [Carboxylicivirga mesophila]MBS2212131.1 MBOAT family protein [Carboxylicivirga mesophila]
MLFNSIDFVVFLPIVFFFYWLLREKLKLQNILIVIASYLFYGWWDWRFLTLIAFSTALDYRIGLQLSKTDNPRNRKLLLWCSIVINLGFLGFFKYYNFFLDNFVTAFSFLGNPINGQSLNIILPVGISFYTFQTLSYTIDVYKRKLTPTNDFVAFAAFVSFFPQLVAGPIERATHLLPQFYSQRQLEYRQAVNGLRQILWGFFKKLVIADNCAKYANEIFDMSNQYGGTTLLLGAIFFAFQIYGDFSGYSDIAIGTARLFGFKLMQNFAFPYFSRDMAEFWRRWHISLSTWFRDYVYIPLGGSRVNKRFAIRNTFIIFIVSGFWHGANWTFIAWGLLNALYFLPLLLSGNNRKNLNPVADKRILPSVKELFQIILTFALTSLAWVFFRAENIQHASDYLTHLFGGLYLKQNLVDTYVLIFYKAGYLIVLLMVFIILEWLGRNSKFAIEHLLIRQNRFVRWTFYYCIIIVIAFYMPTTESPFIYFQF